MYIQWISLYATVVANKVSINRIKEVKEIVCGTDKFYVDHTQEVA